MQRNRTQLVSLVAVVVGAVLFGMVLAGGLGLTPRASADRPAQQVQAPAKVVFAAPDFASLADKVVPAVVSVYAKDVIKPGEGPSGMPQDFFHRFFGPFGMGPGGPQNNEPRVVPSAGSGFFITPDGELLTNNHVVENAEKLEIELNDGSRYQVKVVGRDPATDIALIRVVHPDREFPVLTLGDSAAARVGEWVLAVGNPLNMDHTVTAGIVSAKGRRLGIADTSFENFIQTDAAINFGNSGGPLVNIRGEVIGINTAISARGQNLGFAVPINTAKLILPQLREHGKVVRGYLGVTVRDINQEVQEAFNLKDRNGAFVEEVLPGHAGDKAGLEHGDVIVSVNGRKVAKTRDLIDQISAMPPGSKAHLEVIRNGKTVKITATLEERQTGEEGSESEGGEEEEGNVSKRVGISVMELTDRVRQYYGIPDSVDGVIISHVNPVSPAADEGLRRGDIVTEVNGKKIHSVEQFLAGVKSVRKGGYLRLYIFRPQAERSFFAILKLDQDGK